MSRLSENWVTEHERDWRKPARVALVTSAGVTLVAYLLPKDYAATGVGLGFLFATYWVTLRHSDAASHHYGLSLGGILDREPLDIWRIARDSVRALAWAVAASACLFPLFWLGFLWWWKPQQPFIAPPRVMDLDESLGQLVVIALPEEAFFRGYLQTAFDDVWPARLRVLGGRVGVGLLLASAIFALGHVLTELHPNRLAVFFPALVFGWLRARTGGIGAATIFHASCNVFASFLAQGYGLAR